MTPPQTLSPTGTDTMNRANRTYLSLLRPAVAACALAIMAPGVLAENVIEMGYGEGSPGDEAVQVIVTASNDTVIHGYSIAFTYPSEVLTLTSISTSGTQVESLEPDFVAPRLDDSLGVGNLGVIFAFTEPITLKELEPLPEGAYPRVVARLTFDVKPEAPGGLYPLKLVDGIGQPASFNRFSSSGTSIAPRLVAGSFRVAGGNVLTLEKKMAFPGIAATHQILAFAGHPVPLAGFQIGFTFNKSALELTDATYSGTALGFELGNDNLIEAYSWNVDTSYSPTLARGSVATLFDFVAPFQGQVLSPCTDTPDCQSLVKFTFDIQQDADQISQHLDLELQDTGVPGLIDNRFIVGDMSLDPELVDGRIYFSLGDLQGRVIDSVSLEPVAGATITTKPDGYTTSSGADGTFRLEGIPAGKYELLLKRTGYYQRLHTAGAGDAPEIVLEGSGQVLDIGDIPLFEIAPSGALFLRGRINSDAKVDLSDAVFLLNYLFKGGPMPGCLLAADLNDDNKVDISDTIYMLNHLFLGGPQPLDPYAQNGVGCAPDPTPGDLTCEEFTCF